MGDEQKMHRMYEGSMKKNFFLFALPLVLSALLSQGYHIIDTVMASRLIGDRAVAAIGSTAPLITLISSMIWGYGSGFAIYVAVLFGSGEYKKMANVIKVNIILIAVFSVLISVLCIVFYDRIFDFLNIGEDIRREAFLYFSMYISGLVFLQFGWNGVYIANALGATKIPFAASVITCVLNIAGNYIFVKVFDMGVLGLALATVLAAFCVSVFYIVQFIRSFKTMKVPARGLYFSSMELGTSVAYAIPNMLQQSVMYFCTAFISPLTNLSGESAIAGFTVGMKLYDLNAGVYQNSNKTVTNYVAQCVGAKKYSVIKKGISWGFLQTLMFVAPFLLVTIFGAGVISRSFLNSAESIHYAKVFMRICMPFALFNVVNNLMHAVFRSMGARKYLVLSTVIYAVSRVAFSYLLFGKFEMYGLYAGMVLSWITEAVFAMCVYLSGAWKSAEYKEYEKKEER